MVLLIIMSVQLKTTDAKAFVVGDDDGWGLKVGNWAQGKNLRAGDTLLFKYDPNKYNVVVIDGEQDYNNCNTPKNAKTYDSGEDYIILNRGMNYFISNLPGMCTAGVRMAVNGAY
ncbi:Basic blue protein [Linum grandiflorum]